jgi:hypothetical protein
MSSYGVGIKIFIVFYYYTIAVSQVRLKKNIFGNISIIPNAKYLKIRYILSIIAYPIKFLTKVV